MNFTIQIKEEALSDVSTIAFWYDDTKKGLGNLFIEEWENSVMHIAQFPFGNVSYKRKYRQSRMHRFPYLVMYEIRHDQIIIYAVLHTSRHPRFKKPKGK